MRIEIELINNTNKTDKLLLDFLSELTYNTYTDWEAVLIDERGGVRCYDQNSLDSLERECYNDRE